MKIAILSTPKTGNVWLTSLIKEAYGLPLQQVDSSLVFLPLAELEAMGDDWLIYAHVYPDARTLDWLLSKNVHVLTTVRHPCDVLVSLRHYASWSPDNTDDPARSMLADGDGFGEASARYVAEHFPNLLNISASWSRLGATVVRYEEMIADPVGVLRRLTERIGPLTGEQIRKAVLLSQFKRMKAAVDPAAGLQPWRPGHFREGRTGSWRTALGDGPVVEALRSREPFITQFRALGYSLDAAEDPVPFAYADLDPFRDADCFDNGVPIIRIVVRLYLDRPGAEQAWPNPLATGGAASYFRWLTGPAEEMDGARPGDVLLTNLAAGIYRFRHDLQEAFPDVAGADRLAFAWWFLTYGVEEHRLTPEYTAPVQASLAGLSPRLRG